jgi:putative spermidine/putrescine transport system permease protein
MSAPAARLLFLLCLAIYAFLLAPIAVVAGASLSAGSFLAFPPQGLSLQWYIVFFHNDEFMRAIRTSLAIAAVATAVSGTIGTAAAVYYAQYAGRWRESLRLAMLAPLLLPEILTAIALLFFVYQIGIGTRTMTGLLVGHVLMTIPFVFINVAASMETFDPALTMAARSLGATAFVRFRRIMLPLIKTGVIGGCLFAFIASFDMFTISFFLKSIGAATLPIQLLDYLRTNFTPEAAAVSTFNVVLTLIVVTIAEKLVGLRIHRF